MYVDFELVSCEEWIGWSKKGQFEGLGDNPWWGCCPANPSVEKDTICGYPAENKAPAPQETDRIKPTNFPFVDGSGSNDEPVVVTTTSKKPEQTIGSCWSLPDYKCCSGCDIVYTDNHNWGVENGEWCGIDDKQCGGGNVDECAVLSQGYPCCQQTCDVVYVDDYKWGVENGEWCGIKDSC
ncbi:hypothetical protein BCR32DRAFT_54631 [Anaeromyces robustus]|uniref:CBM10 domain-containing protein n=1 Tax=Anaeromyces robustus TaxID=1754192 RepID=A0A1Y1XKF7_9FUNG|nr:hypothetical protein BCR32DRAFT_54631 [Anaeromyces robustus]|eukprot:ORX86249.1 hypothetical protein BCR32DRAFT_54631 [Anaeromyces robustus]